MYYSMLYVLQSVELLGYSGPNNIWMCGQLCNHSGFCEYVVL